MIKLKIGAITILMITAIIILIVATMWPGTIGKAWQDMNASTPVDSLDHAAVSGGQIFASGFNGILVIIGCVAVFGVFLLLALNSKKMVR